jgi:hypothetical protein
MALPYTQLPCRSETGFAALFRQLRAGPARNLTAAATIAFRAGTTTGSRAR